MSQFIEVGKGISEGIEEEPAEIENPTNIQDDLEDQPVGGDEEDLEEEHPTGHTTMALVGSANPQHASLKKLVKPHSLPLNEIIIFLSVNCWKIGCIGASIGSGIENTNELKVLRFEEVMASTDKMDWQASVDHEHECMIKNGVWEVVDKNNVPPGAIIIDSTWAMKKKPSGESQARLAARGFKQTQGNLLCIMTYHHRLYMTSLSGSCWS